MATSDAMIDCDPAITCPNPSALAYTFCGRIVDIESDAPVADPSGLQLRVYDASMFGAGLEDATPVTVDELTIDSCGRFRAVNVPMLPTGTAVITVDDDADDYVTAAISVEGSSDAIAGLTLRAVRTATDDMWTSQVGLPPGASFSSLGAWIAIFTHNDQPVEGVELTRGIATVPSDSFYFADQDADRTTIDPAVGATGANGAGLMIDSPLQSHSGTGGELNGCEWPDVLVVAPPDVFFVSELPMVVIDSDDTCP